MLITRHIRIETLGAIIGKQAQRLLIPNLTIISTDAEKLRFLLTGPYKPGYRVNPLPYGHSKIFVNNTEYFFFDGYFYRPSPASYVIVEAPIGAIVFALPRLHQIVHWRSQPYYIVGNTFYRRHPRGYIVAPDPGFAYR